MRSECLRTGPAATRGKRWLRSRDTARINMGQSVPIAAQWGIDAAAIPEEGATSISPQVSLYLDYKAFVSSHQQQAKALWCIFKCTNLIV